MNRNHQLQVSSAYES